MVRLGVAKLAARRGTLLKLSCVHACPIMPPFSQSRDTQRKPSFEQSTTRPCRSALALKRRVPNERNRAYLSYREAARDIGAGKTQVSVWFAELQHYGFIVLCSPAASAWMARARLPTGDLQRKAKPARRAQVDFSIRRRMTSLNGTAPNLESRPVVETVCPAVGDRLVPS